MDFTIKSYKNLLDALLSRGFSFMTFAQYIEAKFHIERSRSASNPLVPRAERFGIESSNFESLNLESLNLIILRHDVDDKSHNSLRFAQIQAALGIVGTYYFRMIPQSYNEKIIREMVELGHEVGYHYETMDTCKGDIDKAYNVFCRNLEKFQKFTPVKTISMHGSPLSKFDNRDIWKKYDYKKLGIIAEPYFDINFNELYYITDTGRRWDGHLYNVRDKATKENPVTNPEFLKLQFHSTKDIIKAVQQRTPNNKPQTTNNEQPTTNTEQIFPNQAMLNFHPQRWNDKPWPWLKELVWQNVKNQGKWVLLKLRG